MPKGVHNGHIQTPLALSLASGSKRAQERAKRVPLLPEWGNKTHGMPDCPAFVNPAAKKYWDTICNTMFQCKVITPGDLVAMAELFDAFGSWLAVKEQLERDKKDPACLSPENGFLFMNQRGDRIVNPTMKLYWDAWDRLLRCCCMFGMTPSSRAGIASIQVRTDKDTAKSKKRFFDETIDASASIPDEDIEREEAV